MGRVSEPTKKQLSAWTKWVSKRPKVVREICERFDPWSLYRMKATDQRVMFCSCNENGTITVDILPEYNELLIVGRQVFGVDPDDLEPCDVPAPSPLLSTPVTEYVELPDEPEEPRLVDLFGQQFWVTSGNVTFIGGGLHITGPSHAVDVELKKRGLRG